MPFVVVFVNFLSDFRHLESCLAGYRVEELGYETSQSCCGKKDNNLVGFLCRFLGQDASHRLGLFFLRRNNDFLFDMQICLCGVFADRIHKVVFGTHGKLGNLSNRLWDSGREQQGLTGLNTGLQEPLDSLNVRTITHVQTLSAASKIRQSRLAMRSAKP